MWIKILVDYKSHNKNIPRQIAVKMKVFMFYCSNDVILNAKKRRLLKIINGHVLAAAVEVFRYAKEAVDIEQHRDNTNFVMLT